MHRATAGLIVSEATHVSADGVGGINIPGIYRPEQIAGWCGVTEAVHGAGGRIFLQLWHVGRVSHVSLLPNNQSPVAPSALPLAGEVYTPRGPRPASSPRGLATSEVLDVIDAYRYGADNARAAGFDGVEIHAANGYLPEQFLYDGTNQRTDVYGGSVTARSRFLLEVVDAIARVWASDRIGIRLSPNNVHQGMDESHRPVLARHLAQELSIRCPAYLHIIEPLPHHPFAAPPSMPRITPLMRANFHGTVIANGGYDQATGTDMLASGGADLISFGVAFLANPDLPARFAADRPLNSPDPRTFYGGDEKGYTDYPSLRE